MKHYVDVPSWKELHGASDTVTQNNGSRTEAYDACGTSAGITFVVAKAGAAVFVVGPVIVVILYYA